MYVYTMQRRKFKKKKQKKLKKNYGCPKKKITSTEKRRQKLSKAVLVEYMLRKFKH